MIGGIPSRRCPSGWESRPHSLYKWLKASGRWGEQVQSDEMEAMRRENLRLKAELKRAEEERDILKKAAAYFAKTPG